MILEPACLVVMLFGSGDSTWDSGARQVEAKTQIRAYLEAIDYYRNDVGSFPTTAQGLQALRSDPGVINWRGPYVDKEIGPDPWGHAYVYRVRANEAPEIISRGIDKDISSLALNQPLQKPGSAYVRTLVFLAAALVFLAYPLLPSILRKQIRTKNQTKEPVRKVSPPHRP